MIRRRDEADLDGQVQGGGDSAEHGHGVSFVLGIFQIGDHRLRRADAFGQLGLGQAGGFAGLVNLLPHGHGLLHLFDPGAPIGIVAQGPVHDRDGIGGFIGFLSHLYFSVV